MRGHVYIENVYAYLCDDDDGTEGIPAIRVNGAWMPLVAADMGKLELMRPFAQELANKGKPVTLVRFSERTVIEVLMPETAVDNDGKYHRPD